MQFSHRVMIHKNELNESEQEIVRFIQDNPSEVVSNSIQDLATELFMHPTTIVRLAKKLDYTGFAEMKHELRTEQQQLDKIRNQTKNNEAPKIDLSEYLSNTTVEKIVSLIEKARDVHFYGIGNSQFLCEISAKQLRCTDKRSHYYQHRHDMLYSIHELKVGDLIFVISMSGESESLNDVARLVKKTGATLISLTHITPNTLSEIADINLYCYAPINYIHNYDVTNRTYAMATLYRIIEKYWQYHI
ncbi:MurR/RpiR family transcriptional regulator [Listeria rocourtiae]|uniref:MurR/RpiR family transcriptional regulator n=1 Tax=Listeria rocourtiae TaxID=647910 RepID=UPI0016288C31|nr:MurR/RpiR family transcriptional regulator [Listeria rocourtiae]MBC1435215.1 MurR/RpiR family transcriptional regulator [Listeria rocourtiae]